MQCITNNNVSKAGFSLVELLVVIGIIAILVAIGSAAVGSAISAARKAVCISNLHQLGFAMNSYATDNNDYYPTGYDSTSHSTWDQEIARYVNVNSGSQVFRCPEASLPSNGGSTYSAHDYLTTEEKPGRVKPMRSSVRRPESTILLADGCQDTSIGGNAYSVFWNPSQQSDADLGQPIPVGPDLDNSSGAGWLRYRHGNRVIVVMVDGHVESIMKGSVLFSNVVPLQ